jgi:hypothetical protein
LPIPRKQYGVYLSAQSSEAVKVWQSDLKKSREGKASFCDALEEMIEFASFFRADKRASNRMQALGKVSRALFAGELSWLKIEPNTGRQLYCSRCRARETVYAKRFSGVLRTIAGFIEQHGACGDEAEAVDNGDNGDNEAKTYKSRARYVLGGGSDDEHDDQARDHQDSDRSAPD